MSDEAADSEVPQPTPPRKQKRKQRAAPDAQPAPLEEGEARDREGGAEAGAAEVELGPDLPAFARGFPRDEALDGLLAAIERGDHAAVRAGASRLAKEAPRDDIRRAAGELLRRIDPDPLAATLLLAAVAMLAFLSVWYWSHAHAAP